MTRWMEKLKDQGSRITEIDIINMGIKYGNGIERAISESHTRKKRWLLICFDGARRQEKGGEGAGK